MNSKPVIFALANPTPEISPEEAKKWGAYIIATGRWDYPNQVNNVLVFPGIFRGVLDARISQINEEHQILAAQTLALCVKNLSVDSILPTALQTDIVEKIAKAITDRI